MNCFTPWACEQIQWESLPRQSKEKSCLALFLCVKSGVRLAALTFSTIPFTTVQSLKRVYLILWLSQYVLRSARGDWRRRLTFLAEEKKRNNARQLTIILAIFDKENVGMTSSRHVRAASQRLENGLVKELHLYTTYIPSPAKKSKGGFSNSR